MNPNAVAHAGTISVVSATAKRMDTISDMLRILSRYARNGSVRNDGKRSKGKDFFNAYQL